MKSTASRHYLHQHAELSFKEQETTAYLVEELEKMGIPVQKFDDYTGCIATIKGGRPGEQDGAFKGGYRRTSDSGEQRR